jgi:hypothetical protein
MMDRRQFLTALGISAAAAGGALPLVDRLLADRKSLDDAAMQPVAAPPLLQNGYYLMREFDAWSTKIDGPHHLVTVSIAWASKPDVAMLSLGLHAPGGRAKWIADPYGTIVLPDGAIHVSSSEPDIGWCLPLFEANTERTWILTKDGALPANGSIV